WNTFYNTPSNRITAGTGLTWNGNTLNASSSADINYWTLANGDGYRATSNVGIGTNDPQEALDVNGNVKVNSGIGFGDPGAAFNDGGIYISRRLHQHVLTNAMNLGGHGGFTFSVADTPDATSTPKVVIDLDGNLGIGTTTPSSKLTVAGHTYLGGHLTAT